MTKPQPTPTPQPPLDCTLGGISQGASITVGQKFLLQCKTSGILELTPQSQIQFDVSEAPKYSAQALSAPTLLNREIDVSLTSYHVGVNDLSRLKFIIDGKEYLVSPQSLTVASVVAPPETNQKPTPYPLVDPLFAKAPLWWWILWGSLALALALFIGREIYLWNKRRKLLKDTLAANKPLTPQEKFQTRLRKLESQGLHTKGEYKLFALELTNILKTAIGEQFKFPAEDLTSEELVMSLERKQKAFFAQVDSRLRATLSELDQIKFAKVETSSDRCVGLLDQGAFIGRILFGSSP